MQPVCSTCDLAADLNVPSEERRMVHHHVPIGSSASSFLSWPTAHRVATSMGAFFFFFKGVATDQIRSVDGSVGNVAEKKTKIINREKV